MRRLIMALLLIATPAAAAEVVPVPRERPPGIGEKAVPVPKPRLKPRDLVKARSTVEAVAPTQEEETPAPEKPAKRPGKTWPGASGGWPDGAVAEARSQCDALLAGMDIDYDRLAPLGKDGGCGAPAPVAVTAIDGVSLEPAATMTCALAAALHQWIASDLQPAAKRRLATRVTTIHTASSYVCRRRNNASSGKLSEHGRANALDMSGFSFAKSKAVAVGGDGWGASLLGSIGLSGGNSFLNDIRTAACRHFTTVLGPGSDPYHGDHFHVDVLERRGGYRICK